MDNAKIMDNVFKILTFTEQYYKETDNTEKYEETKDKKKRLINIINKYRSPINRSRIQDETKLLLSDFEDEFFNGIKPFWEFEGKPFSENIRILGINTEYIKDLKIRIKKTVDKIEFLNLEIANHNPVLFYDETINPSFSAEHCKQIGYNLAISGKDEPVGTIKVNTFDEIVTYKDILNRKFSVLEGYANARIVAFLKRMLEHEKQKKEHPITFNQNLTKPDIPEIQGRVSRELTTLFLHILNKVKFDNSLPDTTLSKIAALLSGYSENSYRTRYFNKIWDIAKKDDSKHIKELYKLSKELGLTEFTKYIQDQFSNDLS